MTTLFFDTGPIITLVMSRLAWILPILKQRLGGKFYITPAVKYELVDRPITVKRFEFEALESLKLIREGVLEIYDQVPQAQVTKLKNIANKSFRIGRKGLDIIQAGEMESLASGLKMKASAIVMDERTLRLFVEQNKELGKLLRRRFKRNIAVNQQNMESFTKQVQGIPIIRSIELLGVAYKMGLLDSYIPQRRAGRNLLVDSFLWAARYNGCAVTDHEIAELKLFLLKKPGN